MGQGLVRLVTLRMLRQGWQARVMLGAALVSAVLGRGGGGLWRCDAIEAGLSEAGEMGLQLGSQSLLWG